MPSQTAECGLKEREREILTLLARGFSTAQIAKELHLAEKTVYNRISDIIGAFGVANRTEAILLVQKAGLRRKSIEQ